ncbi:MAG: glycoside hydrolase family 127 protein [Bacteroidetes bacterium]|nr:glycoside hydrolase family 127 protein [Bacteroidota bacterium]
MRKTFACLLFLTLFYCKELFSQQESILVTVIQRPAVTSANAFYTGNKSPLAPLRFIKLPIGSIKPGGWVLKYLELQRDGLTGHLGEISAWLDKNDNAWFSGNGKGSHGWEEVPYWLKGYGDLGYILHDEKIIAETKIWLEKVFQSQTPDGYFGPRIVENDHQANQGNTPDLWPNMIMLWTMQSYYDYNHDARVLPFMTKYFKWQMTVPDDQLLRLYWENSRGGDNLYSIYWLYNRTGEKWLLDLANKIHKRTADWTLKDSLPNWHNVNIAQCFREPATYFMQTKDTSFLHATYNDFYLIRNLYGQVPGGMFGADENARVGFDDPRQGVETCGMVEQMASDEILTAISGDPMWADNCEDVAFNTYPAAVMPDFRGLRYLTAPNMVVSDSKNHAPGIQNEGPFLMMNPFNSRCCQHNHSQGWPYYAEHLWMATPDNGVAAIFYNNNEVELRVGDKKGNIISLKQTTNYPFDEHIKIQVSASTPINFPLYLRVPGWCDGATLMVNGKKVDARTMAASYIRIENKWRDGDIIELNLPMTFKIREWQKNKNSVSLNYGPLTFSLKIDEYYKQMDSKKTVMWDSKWQPNADQTKWPSYEIYPASMWNYGLILSDKALTDQFELMKRPWPANDFPFTQDAVPFVVKAKGKIIPEWGLDKYGLCDVLPQSPVAVSTKEQNIELIPMGAAKLRISSFPVVK